MNPDHMHALGGSKALSDAQMVITLLRHTRVLRRPATPGLCRVWEVTQPSHAKARELRLPHLTKAAGFQPADVVAVFEVPGSTSVTTGRIEGDVHGK